MITVFRASSGSLATFAAIRRASSLVSSLADAPAPSHQYPAFQAKGRPMILALRPPVRAIPITARERHDNVLMRVPVVMRLDQSNVTGPCLYSG